ncbi:hypothetical protein FHW84_002532 [Dyella sp. SG562]|uniref:hypothetical protein n=1 Tax=Dyella sp. SG562 TaxID=2587017 RepID=UPI001420B611|nr:hypothetical protein [Dyella sp. SG562]NII73959.1 hypothetical protein [Dyella sp. SG562]
MTDEQKVQEAFEAWLESCYGRIAIGMDREGRYVHDWVNDLLTGWKARDDLSHASATAEECSVVGEAVSHLISNQKAMSAEDGALIAENLESLLLTNGPPRAAEDSRDAERYRELFEGPYPFCFQGDTYDTKEEADQAIDRAIAAKRGEK